MKLTLQQAQEMMDKYGNLDLSGMRIESLPDGLVVPGNLDLSKNSITELPKNLTVGGSLFLRGTNITKLPQGLKVGRRIFCDKSVDQSMWVSCQARM